LRIGVFGVWHLGSVTAGCVSQHFETVVVDPDAKTAAAFAAGTMPVDEPGLADLVNRAASAGRLRPAADVEAFAYCDVVWITFDTPVDANDVADTDYVEGQTARVFPVVRKGTVILISSQMPVGSVARLADECARVRGARDVMFACSPENLRLGKAVEVFTKADRIIVGVDDPGAHAKLATLMAPFGPVIWMGVASAEMTKHAINSFLALSITFMNEIAGLSVAVGADAKEVETGLKSEARIGPYAYLSAGPAFGGGTLARDQAFLAALSDRTGAPATVIRAVRESNDLQKNWMSHTLTRALKSLKGRRIALLGLTYKPGTNTLRRSVAVELASQLVAAGADVVAFDPAIRHANPELPPKVTIAASAEAACAAADGVVVCTKWPEFASLSPAQLGVPRRVVVVDPFRFLPVEITRRASVEYFAVGYSSSKGAAA
jgi:UDPglucose 6-dehydrogenase